jgi:predicted DNA-binding transcriptional regulator AlpA
MATNNAASYEKVAFSIDEFCARNSISRRTFYNLLEEGIGPRVIQLRGRRLISAEAEADWHRERENAA